MKSDLLLFFLKVILFVFNPRVDLFRRHSLSLFGFPCVIFFFLSLFTNAGNSAMIPAQSAPMVWMQTASTTASSSTLMTLDLWLALRLPYCGCITAFFGLSCSTLQQGQEDNGDCMQTFDEKCVRVAIEMAKQRTTQFDETRAQASDVCTRLLLGGLADSCEKFVDSENGNWGGVSIRRPILPHQFLCPI